MFLNFTASFGYSTIIIHFFKKIVVCVHGENSNSSDRYKVKIKFFILALRQLVPTFYRTSLLNVHSCIVPWLHLQKPISVMDSRKTMRS